MQIRKEAKLEIEVVVRQAREPVRIHEEPSYGQNRLVVRCRWVAKCAQVPGFVDEAKLQIAGPKKKLWPTNGGHRVCRPHGVGKHAEAWLLPAT